MEVRPAVVKGVSVDVVTYHTIRGLGYDSMHTQKNLFAADVGGADNVCPAEAAFEEPVELDEVKVHIGVNKNKLVGLQMDFTEGCVG